MACDEKVNEEHSSGPDGGGHRCWSARVIISIYRLMGIDFTPLIANERRFNVLARVYVAAGIIGLVSGIGGLVAALYALYAFDLMLAIVSGIWLLLVSMLVVLAVGRACRPAFWLAVRKKRNLAGAAFGVFHALIIGYLAYVVLTTADRLWPTIWLYAAVLDFPVSLLYWILDIIIPPTIIDLVANPTSRLNNLNNFWIPFVFFLTAGTAWWFMLPRVIIGRSTEAGQEKQDAKQAEQSASPPLGR